MRQQGLIPPGEHFGVNLLVHRGAQAIRPMRVRSAAELPQGRLQTRTQAFEALGEAHRPPLPVRIRQHKVVQQVIERLALDPDLQGGHVGEIRLPQGARLIPLLEEHLLRAPRQGSEAAVDTAVGHLLRAGGGRRGDPGGRAHPKWEQIFKDPMTTAAAIDRLVHHSIILELNVPSYRLEHSKKTKAKAATAAATRPNA